MSSIESPAPVPAGGMPLHELVVHLHPSDNVAIAKARLQPGTILIWEPVASHPVHITVRQTVPPAHKIALHEIRRGQPVRRYGQLIGVALRDIHPGEHVHTRNLGIGSPSRDYAVGKDHPTVARVRRAERRTFLGYRRANGQVATRNYVAVISTVNCSAHACLEIAHHFTPERLSAYPNIDGVIALTFRAGCTMQSGGETYTILQRALAGMARHPNVGACVLVGLGCETNQASALIRNHNLDSGATGLPIVLSIQGCGGISPTIEAGIAAVTELLPGVDDIVRTPQPISRVMLALQCGGSDGWSGVTANPVVGLVADELVRQGGTVVLAENSWSKCGGGKDMPNASAPRSTIIPRMATRQGD